MARLARLVPPAAPPRPAVAALFAFLSLVSAPVPARAQAHSECWYLSKSGYNVRGVQPSSALIWSAMRTLSQKYNVPIEIVASVAQLESGWRQFADDGVVVHNRANCVNLYRNPGAQPNPPDVGLMQLTGETARAYDVQRLISDYAYNLEAGVKILNGKWRTFYGYYGPLYWPGRPMDHDRMALENWWYPLKMYNGWHTLDDFTYVELVCRRLEFPSPVAADFLAPVHVTRPGEAMPGYHLPPAPGDLATYFKAYAPGNRFVDGFATSYWKPTHRGTFGENAVTVLVPGAWRNTISGLNVRTGPGTGNPVVGTLSWGATYVANATSGGWYRIWFNGAYGWCSGSYLAPVTGVTGMRVTISDLNVRSGPGTSYGVIGKAHTPEIYIRAGGTSTWVQVNWGGQRPWLSAPYVSPVAF